MSSCAWSAATSQARGVNMLCNHSPCISWKSGSPVVVALKVMARNRGHLSPYTICGVTPKIKMAESRIRRRLTNVIDYSELNALSSVVLYKTSKRKKTGKKYLVERIIERRKVHSVSHFLKLGSPYM